MTATAFSFDDMAALAGAIGDFDAGKAAFTAGDMAEAARQFGLCAALDPNDHEARYWLFSALSAAGQTDAADAALFDARNLHALAVIREVGGDMARFTSDPDYCAQFGLKLFEHKLMASASVSIARGLDLENLNPQLLVAYGLSLQHQRRIDEAINVFAAGGEALGSARLHESLLYLLFHVPDRAQRLLAESQAWADRYMPGHRNPALKFTNPPLVGRRLRIGYVGPDLTHGVVSGFLLPVLEAHDPASVEVFAYSNNLASEQAFPAHCNARDLAGLSDDQAAALIRADGVDVLIDVWGHNANGRLGVFAHRPAPVQAAWINFVQTTGLSCIDYVLHADCMDVPGTAEAFIEEVWSIGEIMAPYRPSPDRLDPVATPALKNGHVTFGSFNNPAKLSDETIAAWGRILAADASHRLVLKYVFYRDPVLQRVTQARLAAHGALPEQIEFRTHSSGLEYLAEFRDIDLALDPSPCPGGTTTCDAMANGVPVLTLDAGDFYTRIGVSVVLPCGLPELVAESWDDYVARALSLTADLDGLNALRARVRPSFDASAYRDEAGFARQLEGEFRKMFDRWTATT
ncbi:tetratricopeptide repeat protein [soil metagenome]